MASVVQPAVSTPLAHSPQIDVKSVESGLPIKLMMSFLDSCGLELKDIYDIIIPARTLTHRRARQENLSPAESDKLARLMRIYDHTLRVFGTQEKALNFLRLPKRRLEGRSPLQMLQTEVGGAMVDAMLWQLADGVFL
jgi:putative toxin-antitoxin system antitoxin component (TIGR02293 family)